MQVFNKVKQWADSRGIIENGFTHTQYARNIIEELTEQGIAVSKELQDTRIKSIVRAIAPGADREATIDSVVDIMVFSINALYQLDIDPECALEQVLIALNSRVQDPEQVERWKKGDKQIGEKWMKDILATRIEPSYDRCLLKSSINISVNTE